MSETRTGEETLPLTMVDAVEHVVGCTAVMIGQERSGALFAATKSAGRRQDGHETTNA
jgi:hypothetical protein